MTKDFLYPEEVRTRWFVGKLLAQAAALEFQAKDLREMAEKIETGCDCRLTEEGDN